MSRYSDLVRYFNLCMKMKEIKSEILSLQSSTNSRSIILIRNGSNPRTDNPTEKNALRIVQLQNSQRSIFTEIERLQREILEEIEKDQDEQTRYTMWCIVISYGNMISAQRLSCMSKKKFYSIFDSYMEKVKENV